MNNLPKGYTESTTKREIIAFLKKIIDPELAGKIIIMAFAVVFTAILIVAFLQL